MSTPALDYNHLHNLLAAQQWKEADDETTRIMLKIAAREAEGWLDYESIAKIPWSRHCVLTQPMMKFIA